MTTVKIKTLSNGDVEVTEKYFDGENWAARCRIFRTVGAYVHQVYTNGATCQTCEGLRATGPTLMSGAPLADVIRNTLE